MTGGAGRADAVARLAGELHTFEEWAHKEAKKLVRASYGEVRLLFTEPAAASTAARSGREFSVLRSSCDALAHTP